MTSMQLCKESCLCLLSALSLRKTFYWLVGVVSVILLVFWWELALNPYSFRNARLSHRADRLLFDPILPYPRELCVRQEQSLNLAENEIAREKEAGMLSEYTVAPDLRPLSKNLSRVLLIAVDSSSANFREMKNVLVSNRIKYKTSMMTRPLPDLTKVSKGVGKYGAVLFQDFHSYLGLEAWARNKIDDYCAKFDVGMVAFLSGNNPQYSKSFLFDRKQGKPLEGIRVDPAAELQDLTVASGNAFLRITKAGATLKGETPLNSKWVTFDISDAQKLRYEPVVWATDMRRDQKRAVVVLDHGDPESQSPRKVLFGGPAKHFIIILLMLDALDWLSQGKIAIPLERYVLVDIDDVFVGKVRFLPEDVAALLESQRKLQEMVEGFRYNLGFSGGYFHLKNSNPEQIAGDDAILAAKDSFWWFPHTWLHLQPHLTSNITRLKEDMLKNKRFSREKSIPVNWNYAVSPHHSGVYPVHEVLYKAWKEVWDIKVTSTEEYPHLRPAYKRRGFIHANSSIQVLPRQVCGLYTKNLFYYEYPGGPQVLENSIRGGELFQTLLYNRINIFMTHMPNYCHDRLAPYVFETVFSMLQCFTNLRFKTVNPLEMANMYFKMYPDERMPLWGNPCNDKRHLDIVPKNFISECQQRLPSLLILGPQKTGTTALHSFLKLHPSLQSSRKSDETFEEVQFFSSDANFGKGLEWYMSFFPPVNNSMDSKPRSLLFEKSATYFDRCLEPGLYAHHLERWRTFYNNSRQIIVLDGEQIRYDPASTLNWLQKLLKVEPYIDYDKLIKYDKKKGFFCELNHASKKTRCLGKGKGRHYPPMTPEAAKYLKDFYRPANDALEQLLARMGYPIPTWLEDELRDNFHEDMLESFNSSVPGE